MKWYKELEKHGIDTTLFVNEPSSKQFHKAIRIVGLNDKGKYEMLGNKESIGFKDDFKCNLNIDKLEEWKYKEALKGIVFKENGINLDNGYKLVCVDLDMKDKPDKGIIFTKEERIYYYLETLKRFGIDKNYTEQELTGSKGIHIFVKVKAELIDFGYGTIDLGKAEIEIFTRSRGIITAPSTGYKFFKKKTQYLEIENLVELKEIPEIAKIKISNVKTGKVQSGKAEDVVPTTWEHEELYRACIGGDLGELKSLQVRVNGRRIRLNRFSTTSVVQLFKETEKNYKVDNVIIGDNKEYKICGEYIKI
ncbi:MAG: hypothetical protein ACRC6U_11440 [Fusobacteriaceae bacterium]